jgi:hypothetical protein
MLCLTKGQPPAQTQTGKVGLPADGLTMARTNLRAGIFTTKDLNVVAMDQFVTDDVEVCRWSMGDEEKSC